MAITLFGLKISVYTRIARLILEEKHIAYDLQEVDVFADSGPTLDYLKYHPFGKVPCLKQGDFTLYETTAICRYVDEIFPVPSLQPDNAIKRAKMNQIISMMDSYAYQAMVWDVFVQRVSIPEEGGHADEQIVTGAMDIIDIVLLQLEASIAGQEFLLGESVSLADLHAFPMLLYFEYTRDGKTMLENYPELRQWLQRLKLRDNVIKTQSLYG